MSTPPLAADAFFLVLSYPAPTKPSKSMTIQIPFEASYHDLHSPWLATVDLLHNHPVNLALDQAIHVSLKGRLTLIIQNEFETPVRLLVFPYDLRSLPCSSTVLLRRLWYVGGKLKYTAHIQFASFKTHDEIHDIAPRGTREDETTSRISFPRKTTPKTQKTRTSLFLFREIKLTFPFSSPDPEETIRVHTEGLDTVFHWTHWPTRSHKLGRQTIKRVPQRKSSSLSAMTLAEEEVHYPELQL